MIPLKFTQIVPGMLINWGIGTSTRRYLLSVIAAWSWTNKQGEEQLDVIIVWDYKTNSMFTVNIQPSLDRFYRVDDQ